MAEQKQKQDQWTEKQKVEVIAAALLIKASAQDTSRQLSSMLGIPTPSLLMIILLAESKSMTYGPGSGVAFLQSQKTEALFRAAYVLAASRRVRAALKAGRSARAAMVPEQRYFEQHLQAMQKRKDAATTTDRLAGRYGAKLGWHATLDSSTSPECRQANGRNFNVGERPAIGYPGSVHPSCRCKPGRPFSTALTVYDVKPDRKAT